MLSKFIKEHVRYSYDPEYECTVQLWITNHDVFSPSIERISRLLKRFRQRGRNDINFVLQHVRYQDCWEYVL